MIRPAQPADLPAIVALAQAKRVEQESVQPIFWRVAKDAASKHAAYLGNLLQRDTTLAFVSEEAGAITGFLIGVQLLAPPVYDPGGPTYLIDDFVVADPGDWATVGRDLLTIAQTNAKARGAATIQVICGHYDTPKRALLAAAGFPIVSEWWVREL